VRRKIENMIQKVDGGINQESNVRQRQHVKNIDILMHRDVPGMHTRIVLPFRSAAWERIGETYGRKTRQLQDTCG